MKTESLRKIIETGVCDPRHRLEGSVVSAIWKKDSFKGPCHVGTDENKFCRCGY